MLRRLCLSGLLLGALNGAAAAQNFSQFIGFGDSTIDTGWYRNATTGSGAFNTAIANGLLLGAGGKFTEGTSAMSPEVLAGYFGLTANPANQPGGTNYATGGARAGQTNFANEGLFTGAVSMANQIANYLAATGGHANGSALYLISIGGNDIAFALDQTRSIAQFPIFAFNSAAANSYIVSQASIAVTSIANLYAAGARYIIVPNQPESFGGGATQNYRSLYADTLWFGLANAGVNFIPADINAVRLAIAANPAQFGFQFIGTNNPACTPGAPPLDNAFALFCAPGSLVTPNAGQTHLFADDSHLTSAGHKIFGDYYYSLVVAPSQISMLAEAAVKSRAGSGLVGAIQNQIPISSRGTGPTGWNLWASGDLSRVEFENFNGFPDGDGSRSGMFVAGADYRVLPGLIVGAATSGGRTSMKYDRPDGRAGGGFDQDEYTLSLYLAAARGPYRFDLIGTYGRLEYDVQRLVPLGITSFAALGDTDGTNLSLAASGGYDFRWGALLHGPFAGLTLQRVQVDGFTETSSGPVALSFADQTRNSAVSVLGYRVSWEAGLLRPFANIAWKHELEAQDRVVTASLTTTAAPSYSLPAVDLGRDWASATVGSTVELGRGMTAYGSVTGSFWQDNAVKYGAQVGLNVKY